MRFGRRKWMVGSAVALGVVAAVIALVPREPKLLDKARPIGSSGKPTEFYWISDHELLQIGNSYSKITRLDLNTGIETPLPALKKWLNRPDTRIVIHGIVDLSPDGRWILGFGDLSKSNQPQPIIVATTLDGARRLQWRSNFYSEQRWLRDSRHWIEFIEDPKFQITRRAVIHNVDAPQESRFLEIQGSPPTNADCNNCSYSHSALTPNNHIITDEGCFNVGETQAVDLLDLDLNMAAPTVRTFRVPLPRKGTIETIAYAPTGDRAAYLLRSDRLPPATALLRRLFPFYHPKPKTTARLWVSRLDGSQMHEIGALDWREPLNGAAPYNPPLPSIEALSWLPGGKRLSFIYNDRLYTVPAD